LGVIAHVKKRRAIIIGGVLGLLLLAFLPVAMTSTPHLTVGVTDYAHAKSGLSPNITLTVTNHSRVSVHRIDRIEIEQTSSVWCNRLRRADITTLAPGGGERIEVSRPEARGRWRVVIFSCPNWRERLDNDFARRLHLRFLYASYHASYSDWIDD